MPRILRSTKSLAGFIKKKEPSAVVLVTSRKLARTLSWAIKEIGVPKKNIVLVPDGEVAKDWKALQKLLGRFIDLNVDRASVVIALGGGSVGDLTGFASSIYLRGVRYIQVPTTLLAQVDSAHGGKTGINFRRYKNQIGSFRDPLAIVVDMRFLESLSKEQIVDGLGEIIKAGLIKDSSILSLLSREKVIAILQSRRLKTIVEKAVKVKRHYVRKDPKDTGIRQMLNFGHTIGHALELKYKITHGRAVLIGMLQELRMGESLGITPPSVRHNLLKLLNKLGISINGSLKPDWKGILRDKKISGHTINLPVMEKEGKSKLVPLDKDVLRAFVRGA